MKTTQINKSHTIMYYVENHWLQNSKSLFQNFFLS